VYEAPWKTCAKRPTSLLGGVATISPFALLLFPFYRPFGQFDLPSLYLFFSEPQQKTKAEHPVKSATSPRMIASRVQDCPAVRRSSTRTRSVRIHSSAPRARMICTRRTTQGRLNSSSNGKAMLRTASVKICARRKCAPSNKPLRITGNNLMAFI
jgi:hypothetical protein